MSASFSNAELETLLHRPVRRLLTAQDRRAYRGARVVVAAVPEFEPSREARQGARPSAVGARRVGLTRRA